MDKFRVEVISQTTNPQQVIYAAMHQDYSENLVYDEREKWPGETEAGNIIVKRLLAGGRGHYGPLEHPQISFNCGYFPHSTVQQIRTHRTGISFDVQSNRYTGARIVQAARGLKPIEEVFYLRPVGDYSNRQGKHYTYTEEMRHADLEWCLQGAKRYAEMVENGVSEEHARGIIAFDVRQHFMVSLNARSLMHLLDLRYKLDAQLECQKLCEHIFPHFERWMPEIAQWYSENRLKKARLSP